MAKADPELQCFLSQGAFGPLHKLRDLWHRRSCLRMLFQQLDVTSCVRFARWFVLFPFGHFVLLEWGAAARSVYRSGVRYPSMISQACSAAANVLNGEPAILMADLF
jgi:hypothetical protein